MRKARVVWLLLLSLATIGLIPCFAEEDKNKTEEIKEVKEIKLEAYQYGYYPDKIVVKLGDAVKISATSRDVAHGILIREYGINVVVRKGQTKTIGFTADKAGEFDIICSVYCGVGHTNMKGKLVVKK